MRTLPLAPVFCGIQQRTGGVVVVRADADVGPLRVLIGFVRQGLEREVVAVQDAGPARTFQLLFEGMAENLLFGFTQSNRRQAGFAALAHTEVF